ncbi:hypothetical protein IW261DRAFT_1444734 [Armillaria novae-zelandiae]|uniref:Uncharacterized protein n=1 Tax=Armillaria novae-zelandiae TaxID=153914 RepID=A0AA39PRV4_9AGAR|nr:hypothetical protein IW261DRAFT_1444734 [Armillaria novae-zelandiae]
MQRPSVLERDGRNGEIQRRSTRNPFQHIPRQPVGGPGTDQRHIQEQSSLPEIMRTSSTVVARLKQEAGFEPTAMKKRRLVDAQQRTHDNVSSSSNTAMTSDERRRKRARGNPSSNPAPPDISEPPFTFEFIRSVADTMEKFDPSTSTHLRSPAKCCPVCGALNHSCLGHFSPSSNGASSAGPDMSAALFTPHFIQRVANLLDEFDPSFPGSDGDINFERDFGQWFNHPDDVGGALDLR